jgi:hypothetical protein
MLSHTDRSPYAETLLNAVVMLLVVLPCSLIAGSWSLQRCRSLPWRTALEYVSPAVAAVRAAGRKVRSLGTARLPSKAHSTRQTDVRLPCQASNALGAAVGLGSGGAKAKKARRLNKWREQHKRRKQRKHQPRPQAQARDGHADADGDEAAGGAAEPAEVPIQEGAPPGQEGEVEVGECAICCEELDPEDDEEEPAAVLPCTHSFHAGCIQHWLAMCARKELKKTCPTCRVECPGYVP